MFLKLAIRNIRRSVRDYAIYFFTLVLGVAIFYIFNSIESQTALLALNSTMVPIVELMVNILSGISVFVAVILGFLIVYASRFLMKRRGREFGIYLTLGMSRRKISTLLLIETVMIGLVSLGVGLLLGVVISQCLSVVVANLFEANLTHYTFVFSAEAALKVLMNFGVIYLVVMLWNTISIRRQRILNLLSARSRTERVKTKNVFVASAVLLAAVVMLKWAYGMVTTNVMELQPENILWVMLVGAAGTLLLVWAIAGLTLFIMKKCRRFYLKGLNTFTINQFNSQINTAVVSITVISLLVLISVSVLGVAASMSNILEREYNNGYPVDIEFSRVFNTRESVEEIWKKAGIDFSEYLERSEEYEIYRVADYSWSNFFENESQVEKVFQENRYSDHSLIVMYAEDYNRLVEMYSGEKVELSENQYLVTGNLKYNVEILNKLLAASEGRAELGKQELKSVSLEVSEKSFSLYDGADNTNEGTIVLADNVELPKHDFYARRVAGKYKSGVDAVALDERINAVEEKVIEEGISFYNTDLKKEMKRREFPIDVRTRQQMIDSNVGLKVLMTFVAVYIGFVALISGGTVLALKELSSCADDRERYMLLRKLGCSERELKRTLLAQVALFFLLPLGIAMIHSIPAFQFLDLMLMMVGGLDMRSVAVTLVIVLGVIYGGYFLVTYSSAKRIIAER